MKAATALSVLWLVGLSATVSALDYPTKPVRVIIATSAGGTSDIFIRA